MKKILHNSAVIVALAGSITTGPISLEACGPALDWFANNQQEVLELQAFAVEGFAQVIKSLDELYAQNPEAFVQFFDLCIKQSNSPIPAQLLMTLKLFNLVDDNAQVSDLVREVLDWSIEQKDDGTIKIWSLNELVKDGWVSLMFGKRAA